MANFNGHPTVYTPKEDKAWEKTIRDAFVSKVGKDFKPVESPVFLIVECAMHKAKGSKLKSATRKPDIDNVLKSVMDAMNGVAWVDDKVVINANACKHFHDHPEWKEFMTITMIWGDD